jgi:hypothetical protein
MHRFEVLPFSDVVSFSTDTISIDITCQLAARIMTSFDLHLKL